MSEHRLHNVVYARLDAIANAEKITRAELGSISRELLEYVIDTHDIAIVNRLIGVLTPVNSKVAVLYFTHFLPWSVEKDNNDKFVRFGKMVDKTKQIKRKQGAINEWLADEANNIWVWADNNIEVEQRQVNVGDMLIKALENAINGVDTDKTHGDPLSKTEIIGLVMQQISADEMLQALSDLDEEQGEQAQAA